MFLLNQGIKMCTAVLSSESEADIQLVIDYAAKLNLKARIINDVYDENNLFRFANESSLTDWLTPEEDEAWKNL